MNDIVLNLATLAGVTIGVTQVVSAATNLNNRFTPLLDLVVSVGLALSFVGLTRDAGLLGLLAGLSASGAYQGAKAFGSRPVNTPSQ